MIWRQKGNYFLEDCEHLAQTPSAWERDFGRGGVDHSLDFSDAVGWELAAPGMLADNFGVGSDVDTVNLIVCYVALHPLNLRPERLHNTAGSLRNDSQLLSGQSARSRNLTLNHEFRHALPSWNQS
jgi:hypothetical protein